jgi:hypothetical protein
MSDRLVTAVAVGHHVPVRAARKRGKEKRNTTDKLREVMLAGCQRFSGT